MEDYIDLVNQFKRQGNFDAKRKQLLELFTSEYGNNDKSSNSNVDVEKQSERLERLIHNLIEVKVEKDPYILLKNKGKMSSLIQTELVKQQLEQNNAPVSLNDSLSSDPESRILQNINTLMDEYVKEMIHDKKDLDKELTQQLKELGGQEDNN